MLTGMESTLEIAEGAASSDPDTGLRAVAALRALTERLEILQVDNARKLGWSWQDIAVNVVLGWSAISTLLAWAVYRIDKAGAPKGLRNGAYRHGLRTIEAIAARREVAEIIKQTRAVISDL